MTAPLSPADEARIAAAWAESAAVEVAALKTIPDLDAWIVANAEKLGNSEHYAPTAWRQLRAVLHQRDRDLRANIRQGVA